MPAFVRLQHEVDLNEMPIVLKICPVNRFYWNPAQKAGIFYVNALHNRYSNL